MINRLRNLTFITVESVREACVQDGIGYVFDGVDASRPGVVYVKTDDVHRYFAATENIRPNHVVVTHGSAFNLIQDYEQLDKVKNARIINWPLNTRPHIRGWYAKNCFLPPPAQGFPCGLSEITNPHGDIELLRNKMSRPNPWNRRKLCLALFAEGTNPARKFWWNQAQLFRDSITCIWYKRTEGRPYDYNTYLDLMMDHQFILSPPGKGEDCHRHWEAMYCGAVPVVQSSPAMRHFKNLPMLQIDNVGWVNPAFFASMARQYEDFMPTRVDQLWMDYWSPLLVQGSRGCCESPARARVDG